MRILFAFLLLPTCLAAADFTPDPLSVRRHGPAYRYPQAGWIVLHIEGKPYDRGYQHGTLLATEIAAFVRCFAAEQGAKDPAAAWQHVRRLSSAIFLRKFDREYLEEMRGIAEGAADAGATFNGRALDVTDIVALNCWAEIDTLDGGLDALPTGLEGIKFPGKKPKAMPAAKADHCSAFAATGKATADGKIVFGHITMFGVYPSRFYNVWLDLKPDQGHRVLMQSYPGGIQSGMDYYLNDAGLIVCETTIDQTRFNADGIPLTNRIRKALQYGESIDDVVKVLKEGNNGLYSNEWLLADTKTNEIAMFELGTKATRLWRSSKEEWFGGTEGFYWGCNNTKDLQVRLETISDVRERPHGTTWIPSARDKKWLKFYAEHKGEINAEAGREAFSTPPICASSSADAKITTTELARQLKTHAIFGPPIGGTWYPNEHEKTDYPEVVPLVPNDWTILHPAAPAKGPSATLADWPIHVEPFRSFTERLPDGLPATRPAWHGTLLAKSDSDLWLTQGFAAYERIAALERALRDAHDDHELTAEDRERLAIELNLHAIHRRSYTPAIPSGKYDPEGDGERDRLVRAATATGVIKLQGLCRAAGTDTFIDWMDEFGRQHAGKVVTGKQFAEFVRARWGKDLDDAAGKWLDEAHRGTRFTVKSWAEDQENTVIVYGTVGDVEANRHTAEQLQYAVARQGSNIKIPVVSDESALKFGAAGLASRHVLLVGGPTTNQVAEQWRKAFPVTFGTGSFKVRDEQFAHSGSAVIATGDNPMDKGYSAVVIAGLSAEATQFAVPFIVQRGWRAGNVLLLPNQAKARSLLVN